MARPNAKREKQLQNRDHGWAWLKGAVSSVCGRLRLSSCSVKWRIMKSRGATCHSTYTPALAASRA